VRPFARPKNMNQGIYWVKQYLVHVDKPAKKPKEPTKQEIYREHLYKLLDILGEDGIEYEQHKSVLAEIRRLLTLKSITSKHMDKLSLMIDSLPDE
jgi:hypothetical protein